jgi:phosphate-selective porin
VVADSERALQLFFFKHGISEVVPEPPQPVQRIEWRDGKTRITTDNAYLEISNRVQVRFTQENPDTPPNGATLPGVEDPADQRGSFRIRRAKFKLEGWFWRQNNLTYEVQLNWPAVNGSSPGAFLEDANIAWDPKGVGKFRVLVGSFKVASFRQQLTSSGSQQFVDRSLVSDEYAKGRDVGLAVQGVLFTNKLEYRASVTNGAGLGQNNNDNDTFQYNGRLMWQPNGNQNLVQRAWVSGALYSESDFESTTVPLYAVALNFESNDNYRVTSPTNSRPANMKSYITSVDGTYKFKGLFLTGEYFWRQRQTPTTLAIPSGQINRIFHSPGWYVQGGQMLNLARTWEVAARYGFRDPNDLIDNEGTDSTRFGTDAETEMRVGLNYYYKRHNLKLQADAGQIETQLTPLTLEPGVFSGPQIRKNRELRIQAQFIF